MIEALVTAHLDGIESRHVRMAYSRDLLENSRFQLRKVAHLASVIGRTWLEMARFRPDVVYYPPGGPNRVPMARDIVTLLAIRPFARRLVLHFHAGGVSEVWEHGIRPKPLKALYHKAFFGADASIQLAPTNPPDGQVLEAKRVVYVPNGVADVAGVRREPDPVAEPSPRRVLYVGAIIEPKGVVDLVTACRQLWEAGADFRLELVGHSSLEMSDRLRVLAQPFADHLELPGLLEGEAKWDRYRKADVFCFPSWFEAEGAPLVVLEAMMFSLPVVATNWRSIPDLVTDGETGCLVATHDVDGLAATLGALLGDPSRRHAFGLAGRKTFEERFSLQRHLDEMRDLLIEVGLS